MSLMDRRRMMVQSGWGSRYQELEYIEADGGQYIETDLPVTFFDIQTQFYITGKPKEYYREILIDGYTACFFVASELHKNLCGYFYYTGGYKFVSPAGQYTIAAQSNTKYNLRLVYGNDGVVTTYVDGQAIYTNNIGTPFGVSDKINMFIGYSTNRGTITGQYRQYKIDGNIGENNVLLIPCLRKSDNIAGIYDAINDKFYASAGRRNFIAGPTI